MVYNEKKGFWRGIYESYIPNRRDNLKQIIIKVIFIVSFLTMLISAGYIANHFITAEREEKIIDEAREIWHSAEPIEPPTEDVPSDSPMIETSAEILVDRGPEKTLREMNGDFKGWITLAGAQVDHPIYQAEDNAYYLNHNQNKQKSAYGALYFDYENSVTEEKIDKNLIVYGHEMNNGSMFGRLKKLRELSVYKKNSTVELTLFGKKSVYRIYAIFVLNASKADDDGYVYNIFKQSFANNEEFDNWVNEAYERSIINTNVEVEYDDEILTLVTCAQDFENARLVVMAKKLDASEDKSPENYNATTNSDPRYPAKWYKKRGIER